jgi:hypothetical protein
MKQFFVIKFWFLIKILPPESFTYYLLCTFISGYYAHKIMYWFLIIFDICCSNAIFSLRHVPS